MRRRAAALTGVLVITPLFAAAGLSPATAASPETVTIGDNSVWTVPAGVTSVTIALTGGDGGTATGSSGLVAIGQGGRGGSLVASLAVQPGDELFFRVATAGSGIDVSSPPADELPGGTGDGAGGVGWVSGGGSSSASLNGFLVAGAPGGGGGAAIWTSLSATLFAGDGGDGGQDADDIVDGDTVVLEGGVAGGNPTSSPNDGQGGNRTPGPPFVLANGAGGAGWPGGSSASNDFGNGDPLPIYLAGGGGGLPFIGESLIDPVAGVKDESAGRDGSASITYTPIAVEADDELAATGAAGLAGTAALAALLLVAGGLAVTTRRRATR